MSHVFLPGKVEHSLPEVAGLEALSGNSAEERATRVSKCVTQLAVQPLRDGLCCVVALTPDDWHLTCDQG